MRILVFLITVFLGFFLQKPERDPRLVGKWMMLFTLDSNGEIIKDEFYQKKYVEEYTKEGKLILDPNFLIDDMKKRGESMPLLDYSAIPSFNWNTVNNNTLRIDLGEHGGQDNRYGFLGDTLILGYPNGNTRYLLKQK